ncbi:MAG: hypothetical protein ACK53Y_18615, partial [bacterium]
LLLLLLLHSDKSEPAGESKEDVRLKVERVESSVFVDEGEVAILAECLEERWVITVVVEQL